jgi:hypothetical protein
VTNFELLLTIRENKIYRGYTVASYHIRSSDSDFQSQSLFQTACLFVLHHQLDVIYILNITIPGLSVACEYNSKNTIAFPDRKVRVVE